jgi:leucyl/phenylalanyl-tRNA--protein transferase
MFSREPNSSKIALVHLVKKLQQWNFNLIDCQMKTEHLMQFGAIEIPGEKFQELLDKNITSPDKKGKWPQHQMNENSLLS